MHKLLTRLARIEYKDIYCYEQRTEKFVGEEIAEEKRAEEQEKDGVDTNVIKGGFSQNPFFPAAGLHEMLFRAKTKQSISDEWPTQQPISCNEGGVVMWHWVINIDLGSPTSQALTTSGRCCSSPPIETPGKKQQKQQQQQQQLCLAVSPPLSLIEWEVIRTQGQPWRDHPSR